MLHPSRRQSRTHGSTGPRNTGSPPAYQEARMDEQEPLSIPTQTSYGATEAGFLPRPTEACHHQRSNKRREIYLIIFSISLFILGYVIQTPLDSSYRKVQRLLWAREANEHKVEQSKWTKWVADMEAEKESWYRERQWRVEQGRRDQEELNRKRRHIEWQGLEAGKCMRYGVREYTSALGNVPLGVDAIDECRAKSIHIHDRDLFPSQCENQGYCGKVTGHFEVDFIEPECTAVWVRILDKGCEGTLRRYDGELDHISEVDNWKAICSTMPNATYHPDVILGPGAFCFECHGWGCGTGYWAIWYVKDQRCE